MVYVTLGVAGRRISLPGGLQRDQGRRMQLPDALVWPDGCLYTYLPSFDGCLASDQAGEDSSLPVHYHMLMNCAASDPDHTHISCPHLLITTKKKVFKILLNC